MLHGIIWTFIIIILVYLFCYFLPPDPSSTVPSISSNDSGSIQSPKAFLPEHLFNPTPIDSSNCHEPNPVKSSLLSEELFPEEPSTQLRSEKLNNSEIFPELAGEPLLSSGELSEPCPDPQVNQRKTFYEQVKDISIDQAILYLDQKGQLAQKIVPHFPPFPQIWLNPPKNKGSFGSIGERHCIEFLELLFPNHNFKKIRPKWLRNPKTNRPLELDGYCSNLMMAVEYNGIQHYVWPNFYHKTKKEFIDQLYRDRCKAELCIKQNICLIRIPYTVPHNRIPLAIYGQMLEGVPGLTPT